MGCTAASSCVNGKGSPRTASRLVPVALALAVVFCAVGAGAQTVGQDPTTLLVRPGDDAARIARTVEDLKRQGHAVELRVEGEPVPRLGAANGSGRPAISVWRAIADGVQRGVDGLPRLHTIPGDLATAWRADINTTDTATAFGLVAASLALGVLAALGVYGLLRQAAGARLSGDPADFVGRLKSASLQAGVDVVALGAFGLVGHLSLARLLPEPDLAHALGQAVLDAALVWGLFLAAGRFLLAPWHSERRLMPLPRATWHMRMLMFYGLVGPTLAQSVLVGRGIVKDPLALAGWILVTATLTALLKLVWFWLGRHDISGLVRAEAPDGDPSLLRRFGAVLLPWFYMSVAVLIWVVDQGASDDTVVSRWVTPAGVTQVLTVLLPIAAGGVSALAASLSRRVLAGRTDAFAMSVAAAGCTLATGAMWVASVAVLVRLWSAYLVDPASVEAVQTFGIVTRAGAAIVTGWAIWTFGQSYFDAHAPQMRAIPGSVDDDGLHVSSRLVTVLPLVRNIALGAVVAVTVLVVMASLGMEIAPFLAGFGVIGLAISFGSQALVRDIVSGIFFMADDAFRVGEYVDTGRLKGTVEKITLRSLQLRHQNGQIHTIPFGQLQSTTNFSRDWATIKFPIRLDREADLELARRTIKRVGEELMADPEFAAEFIQPLKMQGIQEITDTALVIRCKFTCRPFKPTWLHREALKRLYGALTEADVAFATNLVTLRDPTHPHAGAAAAAMAFPVRNAAE